MSSEPPSAPDLSAAPAPAALGRSVVVLPGQAAPACWAGSPRVVVDGDAIRAPAEVVATLHEAWSRRRPVVIELGVDPGELRRPVRCHVAPYALTPRFELLEDRLHFLIWANAYDARAGGGTGGVGLGSDASEKPGSRPDASPGDLVWWHGWKAARRFAADGVRLGGGADVTLADGTPLFIDGGPPHPPALDGAAVVHRWNAEAGSLARAGYAPPRAVLAPDQLAAVAHPSGPVRVIAPAGSGKTRVLTERLRHLLADRHVDSSVVTVLAFNVKAIDELRERCAEVVVSSGPQIRTLNSLGLAICNEFAGDGRLRVLGEMEVRSLVESLFDIPHRANTDTVVPYVEALATIRLGLVDPADAEEMHPDAAGISQGFDRYRRMLAEAGAVDFDEQIYRAIEILLTDPEARAVAQARCRHLLVDEFQDLNPAHLLLIRLLCAPSYDCFAVGDDDQVLYGYSGATPEYLVDYDRYFHGAAHHACEVNYRCPPAVVRAATHLLSYNRHRVAKTVRAVPERPEAPGALTVRRAPGEALASVVVETVSGWREDGVELGEMVVLARVNSSLLPVQVALGEAGIPCNSSLSPRVLGRTGVRTAFSYLRMGVDPERISRRDVEDTVRRPTRGVAPNVVAMLTNRSHTSVREIRRLAGSLTGRDGPKLMAYAEDIDQVAKACRGRTADALRTIRVDLGLGDTMDVLDGSREEPDRSTHHDDLLALESVAAFHPDPATFESWLREVLDRPQADGPAVLLSSVHRIKGREWKRVVVFGVSAGLFPHRLSQDTEGERRVLHVALTRATEQVVVVANVESPSMFLEELERPRPLPGPPPGPVHRVRQRTSAGGGPSGEEAASKAMGGVPEAISAPARNRARPGPTHTAVEVTEASAGLRTWRTEVARREGMPPYIVLSDRHLEGIVAAAPSTVAQLAKCKGIGPTKLDRWGEEILAVLAESP